MTYKIALLVDSYRGMFKIVDRSGDYIEAWRRAAAAERLLQGGIFSVLSTETREDPKRLNHKAHSNASRETLKKSRKRAPRRSKPLIFHARESATPNFSEFP